MKRLLIVLNCFLLLGLVNVWAQAPQKAQIAFASILWDGNGEIYVMDADGKNPRNLTNHPTGGSPSWFDPAVANPVSPAGKLEQPGTR